MAAYLFQIELPEMTEEIIETIPLHREHINKLFASGTILSYSVSAQRNYIWCIISADDEQAAMDYIVHFPLYKFFTDIEYYALLFHNTRSVALPDISLN